MTKHLVDSNGSTAQLTAQPKPYFRPRAAADYVGVSVRCLGNWQRRHIIAFSKIGRTVVFRRVDLDAAIEKFRNAAAGE